MGYRASAIRRTSLDNRRCRHIVAAVCFLLAALPAAPAVADGPAITVAGDRTAYVDVTFESPVHLDKLATTVTFDGGYAGWLMHRLGEPIAGGHQGNLAGAVAIRGLGSAAGASDFVVTLGLKDVPMPAGTYRVYLLANGPSVVNIPVLAGPGSLSLQPATPTTATAQAVDLPSIGPVGIDAAHRAAVEITPNTFAVTIAYSYTEPGATVSEAKACIRLRGEPVTTDCVGAGGWVLHRAQEYQLAFISWVTPGFLDTTKAYDAYERFHIASAGIRRLVGAHLTVETVSS